jgi:DNA repair protein RadC
MIEHQILEKAAEIIADTFINEDVLRNVKTVPEINESTVIFAHNFSSGNAEPSESDKRITKRLIDALRLTDTLVLVHIVLGNKPIPFAERGLI